MTTEEQILASIEAIGTTLEELKKASKNNAPDNSAELTTLHEKLNAIEEKIGSFKPNSSVDKPDFSQITKELDNISSSMRNVSYFMSMKQQETIHKYIPIEKPLQWILTAVIYFIVSIGLIFYLFDSKGKLQDRLTNAQANDIKYRFLKVKNDPITKFKTTNLTTSDITSMLDAYYKTNANEINQFVLQREEDIRKAIEASEIAKQKEAEAKRAKEQADKLNDKIKPME